MLVLPWRRSPTLFPALSSPTVTNLTLHLVFLSRTEILLLHSAMLLTEEALILSYPTLPKVNPMLFTLSCFPYPLPHQLVEKGQGWFVQRDW